MKKQRIVYLIITLLFIIGSVTILKYTNLDNNISLSKSIQIILILFLIRISYGCTLYIKKQYSTQKYSYAIIMNLGLLLFININILRQINLLVVNWNELSITNIYSNTLKSFSFFAMLTLPCIIVLSIYSIITSIILLKKEGFDPKRMLGILLGFLSIIGLFGSQTIYYLSSKFLVGTDKQFIKYTIDICLNASLSYLYTLVIATLYCNVRAAKHMPKYDKDFIIILGSKVRGDRRLTPLLKARADKAIEFANLQYEATNKKICYIPLGGKGNDENIAEAKAIKEYLLKKGINEEDIFIEDKSTSTFENMKFSKAKIDEIKKDAKISFATTNYHVFRSGVIANNQGIDIEGIGSKTKWYFYTNALIREFIASIVAEKKSHIALLIVINVSLLVLITIGRYFNLLHIL